MSSAEMTKIAFSRAKAEDLRQFAVEHLGLEVAQGAPRADMIALIKTAWDEDHILVEPASDEPAPVSIAAAAPAAPPAGKVRIIIDQQEGPGGSEPVFLSVNGRAMLVPRGEEVDIPAHYFEVLKNAERHVYDVDKESRMSNAPRVVPQYPHRVISAAA